MSYSRYIPLSIPSISTSGGKYARYSPLPFGSPTPPPFVPTDIAGLIVWGDSTNADNVVLSGSDITTLLDSSGNGNDITFASNKPTYSLGDGINGLNRMVFSNDTGGKWDSTSGQFNTADGFTAIFVMDCITPSVFPYMTNIISNSPSVEARMQVVPSLGGYNQLTASIVGVSTGAVGLATYYDDFYKTPHYLIINYNGGNPNLAASWTFIINGEEQTSVTGPNALTTAVNFSSFSGPNPGTGAGFGMGGTQEEFLVYNRSLNGTEMDQLKGYLYNKYALGTNPAFTPLDLAPDAWFRGDSVSGTSPSITGMLDKSGNGLNGSLGAANASLLPTAINSQPAVVFTNPNTTMNFNGTNAMINKNTPFYIFGVCSTADWYAASGGPGYYEFSAMSDGSTGSDYGLIFTTLDPAVYPGNTNWIIYVGDGVVPYVGGNATASLINQYFTFIIAYNGGGDFGTVGNFRAWFNGVEDTLSQSPAFADVTPPLANALTTTGNTNVHNAWAEYGIKSGTALSPTDLSNLLTYFNTRYGL